MNVILSIGLLIFTGFIFGELAKTIRLPKISGYILAGILLNPDLLGIMSGKFVEHTDPLLTIALSVITFSIGGTLSKSKIKSAGKTVLFLTIYESLSAFLFVFLFMFFSFYFFITIFQSIYLILAISIVLASLASPTDPSATLAVIHEYKARGIVSDTVLEIAAFDDIMGIIVYTLATAFATYFLGKTDIHFTHVFIDMGRNIGGAILVGAVTGFLFNFLIRLFQNESDGSLIVITLGLILLTYGIADYFKFETLLSTMTLGAIVVNINPLAENIFKLIERYTDELIFVIFFSLSGLHLQLSSLTGSFLIIAIFIVARALGKFTGIYVGAVQFKTDPKIKKYTAGGLIPQGGIVIGLALLLMNNEVYQSISSLVIGIVIGATLIHEITGPIFSRISLKKAGELNK
jgi:Kef-type K+ transport system membrane component KefB